MNKIKWLLALILSITFGVANAGSFNYTGEWVVTYDNNGTPTKFAGGPVSILLTEVDASHRQLTIEMSSDIDNGTGVCGNETEVTVVMDGVLTEPVWAYSISSESADPDGGPPNYPTFGVSGEVLKYTNAVPGFVNADSEIDGGVINGPYCGWITATGEISNAQSPAIGDTIEINFLVDSMETGTITATLKGDGVFEDSFEQTQ